jgi:thioredoxin-like negative regulator of GroEL
MKSKIEGIALLAATICLFNGAPAMATPEDDAAIALYKEGKYGPALAAFEAIDKKQPRRPLTHYYIALCCHALNQVARASQEYQWVADNSPKGSLKNAALKGVDGVSRYKQGRDNQVAATAANKEAADAKVAAGKTPASPATATAGGKPGTPATAKPGEKTAAVPAKPGDMKVKKVLAFTTSYDRVFQSFEPAFQAAKEKYNGKISISTVDPEDEANAALKAKYNVSSFPSFVYLDANGAVLKSESGCPSDGDAFVAEIESLNKKK